MTSTIQELKDGVVIHGVFDVEWLHQNLFVALVRSSASAAGESGSLVPSSGGKHVDGVHALQFELTQCSVPMGSHSLLSSTIRRVLRHALRVGDMCLRLDLVSSSASDAASRECFGDVVYGVDHRGSLQRDLVVLGVARVIRPGFDTRALMKAEAMAIQDARSTFSTVIHEYETSAERRVEVRGVVLDAMRGHWIRVGELSRDVSLGRVPLTEWLGRNGTLLVQVDSLDCDGSLPATWATGFDAARFSQEFLLGCSVRLAIHEAVPADKELSNNTQEIEYDQLAHVKATVYVEPLQEAAYLPRNATCTLPKALPQQLCRGRWQQSDAETAPADRSGAGTSGAAAGETSIANRVDAWLTEFGGDWGRVLVRAGLARVCPLLDFCAPRSENYCALLADVLDLAALHARDNPPLSLRQLWGVFTPYRHQEDSIGSSSRGQDIVKVRWEGMLRRDDVFGKTGPAESVSPESAATRQPLVAAATLSASSANDGDAGIPQPRKHRWTPLKFLCSFEQLLVEPAGPNVSGFITQVARIQFATPDVCSCLRLSVAVALSDNIVENLRKEHRAESRGSISMTPPSTECSTVTIGDTAELPTFSHLTDAECWGPKLRFTASYDPELSGLDVRSCEGQLSVASFSADQPLTYKELHQALSDGRHGSLTLDALKRNGIELSLPTGSERRLFVVECRIRCEGEGVTSAKAFYVLSQSGKKGEDEGLTGSSSVRAEPIRQQQTGSETGAVADEDEEEAFEMAEREAEAPHTEVEDTDVLQQNGDVKLKAGPAAARQVAVAVGSPTSPPGGGVGTDAPAAAIQDSITVHHALIDVLLPLPRSTVLALDGGDVDGRCVWQAVVGALLFKTVDVTLTHVVFVDGRRCFLAKRVASPTDSALCAWVSDHLLDGAALSCVASPPAHPATSLCAPLEQEEEPQAASHAAAHAAVTQLPRFGKPLSFILAEQHGANARPLLPHIFATAADKLGRRSSSLADSLDKQPVLTLTPFAIGLRQLFASHPKHHRNVITETERSTASGWAHVDAAFMRLRFPRLPCYLRSNLEWLPPLVQDALTDVVASDDPPFSGESSRSSCATGSKTPAVVVPREVSLLCMERPLAALLSALLMLTPAREKAPLPRELQDPAVEANFRLDISGFRSTAVLYRAERDEHGGLHECQGFRSGPSGNENRSSPAAVLVFASRRTVVDSAFDPDVVLPIKLPPKVTQRLLVALALESATCVEEDALDEPDRVLGETSFARRPLTLPYWLYQPAAVEGIGVLGEPLVTVPRVCLTELHGGATAAEAQASESVPLCYQYVAVRSATAANPYRFVSYGQLNRNLLVQHQARQWKRGRHVVDYVTVLLRQCQAAGGFPAGVLKAYGNAFEPLYLHYVARDSMRRQIAYGWNVFRSDSSPEELAREEARLWERLLRFAKEVLQRVAEEVKGVPVFLSMDCRLANTSNLPSSKDVDDEGNLSVPSRPTPTPGGAEHSGTQSSSSWSFLVINVFPIEPLSATPTAGPSSSSTSARQSCRDFLMRETVYGRLPNWQVHIRHVGGDALFSYTVERLKM